MKHIHIPIRSAVASCSLQCSTHPFYVCGTTPLSIASVPYISKIIKVIMLLYVHHSQDLYYALTDFRHEFEHHITRTQRV